jgi:ABC-2 type transport system permease protein
MFALPLIKIVDISVVWSMRVLWLIVYVGLTTLFMFLATILSSKLYLKSLLNINTGVRKKKYSQARVNELFRKKKSVFGVLVSNEKKSLFRNPMAFLNLVFPCVVPIIIAILLLTSVSNLDIITIKSALPYVDDYYNQIILGISMIFSITTMYSAVSYSKEGSNNYALNYLPVSFVKVFLSKVFLGTVLNLIPFLVCMGAIYLIIDIDIILTLHGLVCAILAIFTVNMVGVFIDINRPKLKWNSDVEAIKNNMNIFYYMLATVVFYVALIILCDVAGLIELLVIIFILTIVSARETHYRDKLC